jgi:putative phosphoesterase
MPKIGLISDTHSYLDDRVQQYFKDCDEIWHAGDFGSESVADGLGAFKPLRGVYGNIDDRAIQIRFPENLVFECGGVKVLITHIGGSPGKYPARVKKLLLEEKPGLFVCGHSHILRVMQDSAFPMIYMNPGAAGHEGFHKIRTLLRFELLDGKINGVQAIELGKRGFKYETN